MAITICASFQDEVESTKAVKSINSLAQNATKMAPQDLVNIANSLKTFSSKASSENVTLTGEQVRQLIQ